MHKRHRAFLQKMLRNTSQKNPCFETLHNTMDTIYRGLRAQGVGAETHSAEPFSNEEENLLWSSGVFRTDDPVALQRACSLLLQRKGVLFKRWT